LPDGQSHNESTGEQDKYTAAEPIGPNAVEKKIDSGPRRLKNSARNTV
jgi:hypothetical protein